MSEADCGHGGSHGVPDPGYGEHDARPGGGASHSQHYALNRPLQVSRNAIALFSSEMNGY